MKPSKLSRQHTLELETIAREIATHEGDMSFSAVLSDDQSGRLYTYFVELTYYPATKESCAVFIANVYVHGYGIHNKELGGFGFQVVSNGYGLIFQ